MGLLIGLGFGRCDLSHLAVAAFGGRYSLVLRIAAPVQSVALAGPPIPVKSHSMFSVASLCVDRFWSPAAMIAVAKDVTRGVQMADFESIPYRIRIGVTGHRKLDDPA